VLTPEEKAYGLSKFWSEARYNFVFMEKVGTSAWDSIYSAMLPEAINTKNDWEYYKLLKRFSAILNDGHTGIMKPGVKLTQMEADTPDAVFLPERDGLFLEGNMRVGEIGGKVAVLFVNKNLAKKIPVLSEVLEVNHIPVEQYIAEYTMPYISQSADHIRRTMSILEINRGLYGDKLHLLLKKPDGGKSEIELTFGGDSYNFPEGYDYYKNVPQEKQGVLSLEWLEGNIAHLCLNSFGNKKIVEEFEKVLPDLRKAKAIIIDIRDNGGGNTNIGTSILKYFTPDDELYGARSRTRQNISAYKAWGSWGGMAPKDTIGNEWATKSYLAGRDLLYYDLGASTLKISLPASERIIIPTVILTDYFTASAAEDFLIYADNQNHMKRIGRKTFGSTGQPMGVNLGKGFSARICTKDDFYPDGRPFVGVGVLPHIEVEPTIEDYQSGRDPIMEKALQYLQGNL
jgi:Periplasmic protease